MRKLNLLRQLLLTANIGDLLNWKPSTRHIAATLQIINSQYGWREAITISDAELLRRAGYKRSRYSSSLIATFKTEAASAKVIRYEQLPRATIYWVTELTNDMLMSIPTSLPIRFTNCMSNPSPEAALTDDSLEVNNNGNGNGHGNAAAAENGNDLESAAAIIDYLQAADL